MSHAEWVDMVKATGGVPGRGPDTLAALRAISACNCVSLCDILEKPAPMLGAGPTA